MVILILIQFSHSCSEKSNSCIYAAFHNKKKTSSVVRAIQWKCHSIREKLPILQSSILDFDIICLQEMLITMSALFFLNSNATGFSQGKDIILYDQCGICILIKHNTRFTLIDLSHIVHFSLEVQEIEMS